METMSIFEAADLVEAQLLQAGNTYEEVVAHLTGLLRRMGCEGQLPPTNLEVLRDIIASRISPITLH